MSAHSTSKGWRTALKSTVFSITALGLGLAASANAADLNGDMFAGMKARNIGPATMSGRIAAIDVVESDPSQIYIGAASGGVWHSADNGVSWTPIFDRQDVASIGAVAINQSNPSIIWVGTGEGNVRNSVSIGNGIYKSMDGGKTWQNMGLKDSEHINRIAIDPTDPNTIYVAAMGHLWSDGGERGVYKTTDGGKSWTKVLAGMNANTGATDVIIDPNNPNKLYAAMWQFRRYPDYFKSGGEGSGLYVSNDSGATWRQLTEKDGLPSGDLGRAVFAMSRNNSNTVYALVEAEKSTMIRTDDGGNSWRKVNSDPGLAVRPFYYMELEADPNDPETVYNVESKLQRSYNGGANFSNISSIDCCTAPNKLHIDLHSLWINPADSKHMIISNDGGLGISHDAGSTWRFVGNLPLAQYYHINVDNDLPYHVYGGLQDNGSFRGPAEVWENGGIREGHWYDIGFGDGFEASPHPENSRTGYSMSQGGSLNRWNLDTGVTQGIRPNPPTVDTELRFNWNSGFAQDPFNADTIYYGSQFLHKSTDRGDTWQTLTGDLTTNNPELQRFKTSGGITKDVTAAENFQTIVAVEPSPIKEGVIWVGTDDGRVHVTQDGGKTWKSIEDKARGMKGKWVPHIEASPHDPSQAFIVFDDHRRGDMETHVFRIEDYGRKFVNIGTKDLSGYALTIKQDKKDKDLMFLGTEFGLFVTLNGGKKWTKWHAGVPTVSVMDLAVQDREDDLVLGTHGRAVFVIDDFGGLRNLDEKDFDARLKLIDTTDGILYNVRQSLGARFDASTGFRGENAARGAYITFIASGDDLTNPNGDAEVARLAAMKSKKDDDKKDAQKGKAGRVKVEILNAGGNVIRTFHRTAHQGINRIVWDMSEDGIQGLRPAKPGADLPSGVDVVPGTYGVRISMDGITQEGSLKVIGDPRESINQSGYQAAHDHRLKIQGLMDTMYTAVKRVQTAKKDAETIKALANAAMMKDGADKEALKALAKQAGDVAKALDEDAKAYTASRNSAEGIVYTGHLVQSKIWGAFGNLGNGAPNASSLAYFDRAQKAVATAVGNSNALLNGDVAELRKAFASSGLGLLSDDGDISLK